MHISFIPIQRKKNRLFESMILYYCTLFEFFVAFSAWIFELIAMRQHMCFVCADLGKWFATDNTLIRPLVCMDSKKMINKIDLNLLILTTMEECFAQRFSLLKFVDKNESNVIRIQTVRIKCNFFSLKKKTAKITSYVPDTFPSD